jgi:N-acetyl-D-muramate 6-phosphate phosphatase
MSLPAPRAILFDLDGTLADTAPDLAAALNRMRSKRGLAVTSYEILRPVASAGARGLVGAAFGLQPGEAGYEELRVEFLGNYAQALAVESSLFGGIPAVLQVLQQCSLPWGIVTNKAARFTDALVPQIGLSGATCVVSGDTTPHSKPHPEPLFEAARRLSLPPHQCWYVGDDLRDIEAGRAAGMPTIAAAWGYCGNAEPVSWNAAAIAETPAHLIELIQRSIA